MKIYYHKFESLLTGFGLVIGSTGHFYGSRLHFTDHDYTPTSILSHVAGQRLPTADVPLLLCSSPRRVATISRQFRTLTAGFSWYFLQLLAPGLKWSVLKVKVMLRPGLPWCQASIWGPGPDSYYCQTVAGLLMWGAHSDERMGLSFTITAGPRQCNHSRVRVSWDSLRYLTVPNSTLPQPGG
jgi:hypothetical protein